MWSRWSLRRLLSADANRCRRLSPRSLGVGPIGKATLLETKTSGKPFSSSPTTSSATPLPYESAVSTRLTPASIASSTTRRALSRSTVATVPPAAGVNATDPSVRLETNKPLSPSCRNSIAASWRSPHYGNRWGLWQRKFRQGGHGRNDSQRGYERAVLASDSMRPRSGLTLRVCVAVSSLPCRSRRGRRRDGEAFAGRVRPEQAPSWPRGGRSVDRRGQPRVPGAHLQRRHRPLGTTERQTERPCLGRIGCVHRTVRVAARWRVNSR